MTVNEVLNYPSRHCVNIAELVDSDWQLLRKFFRKKLSVQTSTLCPWFRHSIHTKPFKQNVLTKVMHSCVFVGGGIEIRYLYLCIIRHLEGKKSENIIFSLGHFGFNL